MLVGLTGYPRPEDEVQAREHGSDQHLTKRVVPALHAAMLRPAARATGRGR